MVRAMGFDTFLLVTHVFPLEQAAAAISARAAGLPGFVKAAVRPGGS